jgi:hypothetical protein
MLLLLEYLFLSFFGDTLFQQPLMDQFIRLGSQSIGFRNEADILKGNLYVVQLDVSACLFL